MNFELSFCDIHGRHNEGKNLDAGIESLIPAHPSSAQYSYHKCNTARVIPNVPGTEQLEQSKTEPRNAGHDAQTSLFSKCEKAFTM